MSDKANSQAIPEGWIERRGATFDRFIGPFYYPPVGGYGRCGFLADERHANTRDGVHGGMISAAFDLAFGNAAWEAAGENPIATIEMNMHFIGPIALGEFAIFDTEVVQTTGSMVFLRTTLRVGERVVASGQGVFKKLRQPSG